MRNKVSIRRNLGVAGIAALTAGLVFAGVTAVGGAATAAPTIPTGAVENLDFCTTNSLPTAPVVGEEIIKSPSVKLPFSINLFGDSHDSLVVTAAGSLMLDGAQITPLEGVYDSSVPGTSPATYGISKDGSAFCANWVNVSRWLAPSTAAEKLFSFQTIIRDRSQLTGGKPGDVDITFNYDQLPMPTVGEEMAYMSHAAGLATASGNWAQWLPGSWQSGVANLPGSPMLDGQQDALTGSSLNSLDQLGRYTFQLRDGKTGDWNGKLTGQITDHLGGPVAGALVSAAGSVVTTDSNGMYRFGGLFGAVRIEVFPPADSTLLQGYGWASVPRDGEVTENIRLQSGPVPIPDATTTVSQGGQQGGSLIWHKPTTVTHKACEGASSVQLKVTQGNREVFSAAMTEGTPGNYSVVYPDPGTGSFKFTITVNCGDGSTDITSFDVYIDPSGTILNTKGKPVAGATVTLLRADSPEETFVAVADGSAVMSSANRTNPSVTIDDGRFAWFVAPGYYKVEASAPGCTVPGSTEKVVTTEILPVPPEQLGLELVLDCGENVVAAKPALAATMAKVAAGEKQTVTATGFAADADVKFVLKPGDITVATVKADSSGKAVGTFTIPAKSAAGDYTVTATQGALAAQVTFGVTAATPPAIQCEAPSTVPVFADTPVTHKFYKEIDWMNCVGYATGWRQTDGKPLYKPADNLQRQAMAAFIYRLEAPTDYKAPKVSPFADVKPTDTFYKEIAWMHEKKYATGWREAVGKPTFRPMETLSREAMAAFIYRLEAPEDFKAPTVSPMADMKPGMSFYKEISWMYEVKLSTGNKTATGKEFWPKAELSRQAMAAFIYRLVTVHRATS